MNSFRAVEKAMEYEAVRQYEVWQETGQQLGEVPKQTRGWDDVANITRGQRHKEESSDYRYFPEPDLVPVRVTRPRSRAMCGPRSANCRPRCASRLETTHGITPYDSDVLVNQGQRAGRVFRRSGRAGRRRQTGQQLDSAGRAADPEGAERHDRSLSA